MGLPLVTRVAWAVGWGGWGSEALLLGEGAGPASHGPDDSRSVSLYLMFSLALMQHCCVWMYGPCLKSMSPLFSIFLSAGLQTAPEGAFASADALLSRLAHPASLCGALGYLEPDLAEKNPPVFAQKLQVCSPHVTFLEFVKTSVENEPLSQIELRQDLMMQYWECSR